MAPQSTSFTAERINETTFLIIEDDSWSERPHIYALIHPTLPLIVLSDTGCNSSRQKGITFPHLREFLEHYPCEANNDIPINPGPERREYLIICTHCHYDHIGGIEQFSIPNSDSSAERATVLASAHGRDFIENDLPEHSICKYVGMPTPRYVVDIWAQDFERLQYPHTAMDMEASQILPTKASDLGITVIHTPGHTPDELAWYDHRERHLYVGDSFYEEGREGMAIQFSRDGNWIDYMFSMAKLLRFVRCENAFLVADDEAVDGWVEVVKPVRVGCGHTTSSADAETTLEAVIELFGRIITGKVPVVRSFQQRGEIHNVWREKGKDVRFSVDAPKRLCEEIRKAMGVDMEDLEESRSLDSAPGLLQRLDIGAWMGGYMLG